MEESHLGLMLASSVGKSPDSVIIYEGKMYTYQELSTEAVSLAKKIGCYAGVKRGDRVAVDINNCVQIVPILFAIWILGARAVLINPSLNSSEIEYQLKDSGVRVIIVEEQTLPAVQEALNRSQISGIDVPIGIIIGSRSKPNFISITALAEGDYDLNNDLPADDVAVILYTSGTTGKPKGVMLTHQSILFEIGQVAEWFTMSQADRVLNVMPLYHVGGLVLGLLAPLYVQATIVIARHFSALEFINTVVKYKITMFSAVPTMFIMMLNAVQQTDLENDFSSLRFCIGGGSSMPPDLIENFENIFSARVIEGYGLTEAMGCLFNPVKGLCKNGSVGLPLPGVEVRIADKNNVWLSAGKIGELQIKGPNVMKGYWNRETETQQVLKDGWLQTGDMGYMDHDGYFFLIGRKKDIIIRGGENIYPKEIEDVLYALDDIREAAVVGSSDAIFGEEVRAYVSVKPGRPVSESDIISYCQKKLAKFKCPKSIIFLEELPKNATGKINKKLLKRMQGELIE